VGSGSTPFLGVSPEGPRIIYTPIGRRNSVSFHILQFTQATASSFKEPRPFPQRRLPPVKSNAVASHPRTIEDKKTRRTTATKGTRQKNAAEAARKVSGPDWSEGLVRAPDGKARASNAAFSSAHRPTQDDYRNTSNKPRYRKQNSLKENHYLTGPTGPVIAQNCRVTAGGREPLRAPQTWLKCRDLSRRDAQTARAITSCKTPKLFVQACNRVDETHLGPSRRRARRNGAFEGTSD